VRSGRRARGYAAMGLFLPLIMMALSVGTAIVLLVVGRAKARTAASGRIYWPRAAGARGLAAAARPLAGGQESEARGDSSSAAIAQPQAVFAARRTVG